MSKLSKIREDGNIIREKLTIDVNVDSDIDEQSTAFLIKEVNTVSKKSFDNPIERFIIV